MKYKTIVELPKHEGIGTFNLGEAPTCSWRKAEVGSYYYLCNRLSESLFVVRDSYIVKVIEKDPSLGRFNIKIHELHSDGQDKENEINYIRIDHVDFWSMTAQEVEEFKKSAKDKRAQIIDEF